MLSCAGSVVSVMPRVFGSDGVSLAFDSNGVAVDVHGGGLDSLSFDLGLSDGQDFLQVRVYPRALGPVLGLPSAVSCAEFIEAVRTLVGADVVCRVTVRPFSRRDGSVGCSVSASSLSVSARGSRGE